MSSSSTTVFSTVGPSPKTLQKSSPPLPNGRSRPLYDALSAIPMLNTLVASSSVNSVILIIYLGMYRSLFRLSSLRPVGYTTRLPATRLLSTSSGKILVSFDCFFSMDPISFGSNLKFHCKCKVKCKSGFHVCLSVDRWGRWCG